MTMSYADINGLSMYYEEHGEGEPLVLLHGFTGTWRVWAPVIPQLAEKFDVFVPTLAGHCGAEPWQEGTAPTIEALADAAEAELDNAGIETAHVAGNSLGGWLAFELAKRGRARSVVALAPAGGWERGDEKEERRLIGFFKRTHKLTALAYPRARSLVTRPRLRKLMFRDVMVHGERLRPGDAEHLMQGVLECSIFFEFLDGVIDAGPAVDLDTVTCPVLIGWPEQDNIFPPSRYAERYQAAIPGSELVQLPGCGHVPMWDAPDLVARTIADFAARQVPSAVTG